MSAAVVLDDDGVQWWSTAYACEQLGVKPATLRDWVRRSARESGFPRVDPPRRHGRTAAYVGQQLIDAERYTASATRGRRRPA